MENLKKLKNKLNIFIVCCFIIYGSAITVLFSLLDSTSNSEQLYMKQQLNLKYSVLIVGFIMVFLCIIVKDTLFNDIEKNYEQLKKYQKVGNAKSNFSSSLNSIKKGTEHDVLTGLYNKEAIRAKVNERILKNSNKIGGMLFIDIDNIKFINDKYGITIGNEFILKLSEMLNYFDQFDGLYARISGDEFVVYLHGFENEKEVITAFKELYNFSEKFGVSTPDGKMNRIRFSSGVALYPFDGNNFDTLYKYSDFALYGAKTREKGRLMQFDKKEYEKEYFVLENSLAINQLIDEKLFHFAYQPIVDLKSGEIYGYEALLRSKMDNFKSPYEIINVAETQSKLPQLESATIFEVLKDIEKNENVIGNRNIFINTLPNQMISEEETKIILKKYKKYLTKVVIEITEQENRSSCNINMKTKINFLKKSKIKFAIDDFGSGFSNQIRLLEIKPNIIKIDIGLIQNICRDEDKQVIVKNIAFFCKRKGIKIVAEGVEEKEDLKYLIELGIDYAQGFYLGRPQFGFNEISDNVKREIKDFNKI